MISLVIISSDAFTHNIFQNDIKTDFQDFQIATEIARFIQPKCFMKKLMDNFDVWCIYFKLNLITFYLVLSKLTKVMKEVQVLTDGLARFKVSEALLYC